MNFDTLLAQYRDDALSEFDKGRRFERLIKAFLQTDTTNTPDFAHVWLWGEFPFRHMLGGSDAGIDLVARTMDGEYWAIQCKFYAESSWIDKRAVDSFLATSSREFQDDQLQRQRFGRRLWISTTENWTRKAEDAIKNQHPPVTRLNLSDLRDAPVRWEILDAGIYGQDARRKRNILWSDKRSVVGHSNADFQSVVYGNRIEAHINFHDILRHIVLWILIIVFTLGIGLMFYPYSFARLVINNTYVIDQNGYPARLYCDLSVIRQLGHIVIWSLLIVVTLGIAYPFYLYKTWHFALNRTRLLPV